MPMAEHIVFVTGTLAEASLRKVLESMEPTGFSHEVVRLGISVAALMTTDFIARHLPPTELAPRALSSTAQAVAERSLSPASTGRNASARSRAAARLALCGRRESFHTSKGGLKLRFFLRANSGEAP